MRIVVLDTDKKVEKDIVADLKNINLNVIDRPAFCVYCKNSEDKYENLLFKLSNIEEHTNEISTEDCKGMLAVYGKVSGCLYSLSFRMKDYSINQLDNLYKSIEKMDSIRFKENLHNYFQLAGAIINLVNNIKA